MRPQWPTRSHGSRRASSKGKTASAEDLALRRNGARIFCLQRPTPGSARLRQGYVGHASFALPTKGIRKRRARYLAALLQLFFEVADSADQVGQLLNSNHLTFGLFVRRGGNSENGSFVRDITHNTGFGANCRLVAKV
jgi:hypothetical protein